MATSNVCDRCGLNAVTVMEFKTTVTTPVKMDLCEECLAVAKKMMRVFTGQEVGDLEQMVTSAESIRPE